MFSCSTNTPVTFIENPQLKKISFLNYKISDLIVTLSDKASGVPLLIGNFYMEG